MHLIPSSLFYVSILLLQWVIGYFYSFPYYWSTSISIQIYNNITHLKNQNPFLLFQVFVQLLFYLFIPCFYESLAVLSLPSPSLLLQPAPHRQCLTDASSSGLHLLSCSGAQITSPRCFSAPSYRNLHGSLLPRLSLKSSHYLTWKNILLFFLNPFLPSSRSLFQSLSPLMALTCSLAIFPLPPSLYGELGLTGCGVSLF